MQPSVPPPRTIPPELAQDVDCVTLFADLDVLYQSITEPEVIKNQIGNLFSTLKRRADLFAVMIDDDFDLIAAAVSAVTGNARVQRSAAKEKTSKRRSEAKAMADDLGSIFGPEDFAGEATSLIEDFNKMKV